MGRPDPSAIGLGKGRSVFRHNIDERTWLADLWHPQPPRLHRRLTGNSPQALNVFGCISAIPPDNCMFGIGNRHDAINADLCKFAHDVVGLVAFCGGEGDGQCLLRRSLCGYFASDA